jgi:hypothetical protein
MLAARDTIPVAMCIGKGLACHVRGLVMPVAGELDMCRVVPIFFGKGKEREKKSRNERRKSCVCMN